MNEMKIIEQARKIASAVVGSVRYGYDSANSDRDYFILTHDTDVAYHDQASDTTYFLWSVQHVKDHWGHPMLIDDITAGCYGNEKLCAFLREHQKDIAYASPARTVHLGLPYIGAKEGIGVNTAVKPALCTAFILGHMAQGINDPVLFTEDEKEMLARVRVGAVPPEERAEIYRRTLCPENLNKLRRMPENEVVKNELFDLLDEICKEEST